MRSLTAINSELILVMMLQVSDNVLRPTLHGVDCVVQTERARYEELNNFHDNKRENNAHWYAKQELMPM